MKKIFTILFTIIMVATLLVGCQATPENPVVIQKDMEQLIKEATANDDAQGSNSLAEKVHAPETYTVDFDGYKGDLTVHADAKVTIPNSKGISVMRVVKHTFTQQEADKMMQAFLHGETLYQVDQGFTKDEIKARLVTYYGMRDGSIPMDMDGDSPNDTEKLKEIIKYYEDMLASAPDTKNPTPANTKFHAPVTAPNPGAQVIEGTTTVNGKAAYLYINNGFFNDNNIEATFINAKTQMESNYSASPYKILSDEETKEVQVPKSFTLTKQEANGIADDMLNQLGITGMACVDTRFAVMSDEITGGNTAVDAAAGKAVVSLEQLENGKWAYSIQYQRTVNGIPITITEQSGNSTNDDDVSVPWPYERLKLIVDETGVVYFHYLSPYTVQDTITENSTLRDFSEITSVFEKMFPITYGFLNEEGTDYKLQVKITEMRLGLMRITEQNSRDSGLLIPVWDFFGDVTILPYKGDPYPSRSGSLLTLNAIDGSVIDRNLGY